MKIKKNIFQLFQINWKTERPGGWEKKLEKRRALKLLQHPGCQRTNDPWVFFDLMRFRSFFLILSREFPLSNDSQEKQQNQAKRLKLDSLNKLLLGKHGTIRSVVGTNPHEPSHPFSGSAAKEGVWFQQNLSKGNASSSLFSLKFQGEKTWKNKSLKPHHL